jgi:hypothetical protein
VGEAIDVEVKQKERSVATIKRRCFCNFCVEHKVALYSDIDTRRGVSGLLLPLALYFLLTILCQKGGPGVRLNDAESL